MKAEAGDGGGRRASSERKRGSSGVVVTEKEENPKKMGFQITKMPSSSISIPNCSMPDTISLTRIRILNPKSLKRPSNNYVSPTI